MANENTLNIVVVGKSGVGKSSFLNYLLGEEVFNTGIGEPVTQGYFDMRSMPPNDMGVTYVLYDTKGIEPSTTTEFRDEIFTEIEKRDKSSNFFHWIHSVYYCFDSTAKRIEPFEVGFIREIEKKANVIVLLTKSDKTEKLHLDELTDTLHKDISPTLQVIQVCSVESKGTRKDPTPVKPYGREDVLKASFFGLWNKIATYIPNQTIEELRQAVSEIVPARPAIEIRQQRYAELSIPVYGPSSDGKSDVPCVIKQESLDRLLKRQKIDSHNYHLSKVSEHIIALRKIKFILESMHDNPSRNVFDRVIDFYKRVNRFTPQIFFMTESQRTFTELKEYDCAQDELAILQHCESIIKAKRKLASCVIWYSAEIDALSKAKDQYNTLVSSIKQRLLERIDHFVSVYRGELKQYGIQCISDVSHSDVLINSETDLNEFEYMYAQMLRYALEKSSMTIDQDRREMLDHLRILMKIAPMKAGIIEDLVRNTTSNERHSSSEEV